MARNVLPRYPSVCPHDCPSTCALSVERVDERTIGRIYGAAEHPYTAGVICAKVSRYAERIHHPARLTTPLKRIGPRGAGMQSFRAIGWDEALDSVATELRQRAATHGAETVWPYFYAGTMGLVQRDGIERLRHVMGYSRQHSTFCITLSDAGWAAGVGVKRGVDPREMGDADLIVIWGANPVHTQVNVMHHVARARRERGAGLVVVDPYRSATAAKADLHLMPRPGTDGALACAVMHVLFAEGYADRAYLQDYTDNAAALEHHLRSRTPAWAEAISGVPAEQIVAFARRYGATQRSFLRLGYGFSRSRNGAANMHAVSCLPAITGAWQYPGGGALYSNAALYPIDASLIQGLDALDPTVRVLDQSRIGAVLNHDPRDLQGGAPVTALFIQNTNPLAVAPDSARVRAGFQRDDLFICVHEQFLTDTAAMADVVLPASMFLEHADIYQAGGHTFLQVARPLIEAPGEARSNHWVLCQLAERLGAVHPGFALDEWDLINATLKASGLPDADTIHAQGGLDCALDFRAGHFLDGFGHPDGRFRFKPDWAALGPYHQELPALPDHCDPAGVCDARHPFRLVTAPARQFLNTSFTETPTSQRQEGRPTVLVHPDDCRAVGLVAGQAASIGNRQGQVTVSVRPFEGLQTGVLVVESIWPNRCFADNLGINTLVSAEPGWPNGGAIFHDTAVWLCAAGGEAPSV